MTDLAMILELINYVFVLFFGVVVSLYLADINFTDHKVLYFCTLLGFGAAEGIFYLFMGESLLYKCYPLLIHVPLILLIWLVFHRNFYVSTIAVLSAYLLCTPRKWLGTLVASFFHGDPLIANITAICVTIPLLFLVVRYIAPYIIRLKYENRKTILLFFLLPLAYYILEYTFTVYTNLLYTGGPVVIDFMDSFIVLFFFILSMLSLDFSNKKNEAERENLLLTTAGTQAQKEIEQLSISQKQASIYRHDLRHHMTFLQNCIAKNKLDQALEYIHQICTDIDNSRVIRYCNNEALNLILSSYADQARDAEIDVQISVTATDFARFQITDLCSLFANALENAIHACEKIPTSEKRYITLKVFEKNDRICINIANNYVQNPVFENEIPTSHEANHGIGVRSMISVVEKYHGVYGFFTENKEFRFQASL